MSVRKYEVLAGTHYDLAGKEYGPGTPNGAFITTAEPLVDKFGKEKFKDHGVVEVAKALEGADASTEKKAATGTPSTASALGEDVTAEFAEAGANDFKVFRKGKKHFVAVPEAPDVALNKTGLAKDDVVEFITEQVKS